MSAIVRVAGEGFPVASMLEQDALLRAWGGALAPMARDRSPVSRVTWQEWARPAGVAVHRDFLAAVNRHEREGRAESDYEDLLQRLAPFAIDHEVLVTLTVDLRRVRTRRALSSLASAIDSLNDECRTFCSRLEAAGLTTCSPLTAAELTSAVRLRSDPTRRRNAQLGSLRRSMAAAAGLAPLEWGPMAVRADWVRVHVDSSFHRTYRVARWPMLPVGADWLAPLLTSDSATRTVTVVMEPVSLTKASMEANRQLTSIEADQQQKERHGFRLTARERRRHSEVEHRERELADGHPEFRFVGLITVSADSIDALDEAAANVEQAAAQSMLDLRPLDARQAHGWVASLPLGRSVRRGAWT